MEWIKIVEMINDDKDGVFNYIDWNWANYPQWSTWGILIQCLLRVQ